MSPTLIPSWNHKRVYGTWIKQGGDAMRAGTYKVTVPVRVTNATDDAIIPAGTFATGSLNVTPGVPSLDIQVPCTDDPDNFPTGWQVDIEVTFTDAPGEKYVLSIPVAGADINLRNVVLTQTLPTVQSVLIKGVAGGLAVLDADGDVVDADGVKVIAGGGGTGTSGEDGADGMSAYDLAVSSGFVGTESAWLASLKGHKGDTGERGLQGIQGLKGDTGSAGTNGVTPVLVVKWTGSAYPTQAASAPAGTSVRWFVGPEQYSGPTWAGVTDVWVYAAAA